MNGEKGPDEVFCNSCGAIIKQRAEICPECGVPNDRQETDPETAPEHVYCRSCGQQIKRAAMACPHCGVSNLANPNVDPDEHNPQQGRDQQPRGGPQQGQPRGPPPRGGPGPQQGPGPRGGPEQRNGPAPRGPRQQGGPGPRRRPGPQQRGPPGSPGPQQGPPGGPHNRRRSGGQSQYETDVSGNWMWVILIGVLSTVAYFIVDPLPGGNLEGFFALLSWVAVPIGLYFDAKYVKANSRWNPSTGAWLLGAIIPLLGSIIGAIWLFRRWNLVGWFGESDTETETDSRAASDSADPALEELRRRYSQGEIDDAEFERRVERVLQTEDREIARHLLDEQGHHGDRSHNREPERE